KFQPRNLTQAERSGFWPENTLSQSFPSKRVRLDGCYRCPYVSPAVTVIHRSLYSAQSCAGGWAGRFWRKETRKLSVTGRSRWGCWRVRATANLHHATIASGQEAQGLYSATGSFQYLT